MRLWEWWWHRVGPRSGGSHVGSGAVGAGGRDAVVVCVNVTESRIHDFAFLVKSSGLLEKLNTSTATPPGSWVQRRNRSKSSVDSRPLHQLCTSPAWKEPTAS